MALKLKCPCGERLTAPESAAGKRGKCKKCGQRFIIPSPKKVAARDSSDAFTGSHQPGTPKVDRSDASPTPSEELPSFGGDLLDEALNEPHTGPPQSKTTPKPAAASDGTSDAAKPKRKGNGRPKLGGLSLGIKLVLGGTVLSVLATMLAMVSPFVDAELALLATGAALLGGGLVTVGRMACLTAPKQIGGKGFLIAAVACDLGYLLLSFAGEALMSAAAAAIVTAILPLFTFVLFILFLREVGESLKQDALVEAGSEVIYAVLIAGACLVGTFAPILGLFCLLGFIAAIIAAVWKYVTLLIFALECIAHASGRR